jgi:DNA-binding NarL/FixJ family response regulator
MAGKPIRVLLIDDEPMVCAHLRTILGAAEGLEVVGAAHEGHEAVELVLRLEPDVVLMDLRMPGVDGITATERIMALRNPPVVLALTTFDADSYVLRALQAGAAGFLLKTTPPEDLVGLIQVATDGHTVMSRMATHRLVATASQRKQALRERTGPINDLTERETEVLACLGEGLSNAQIARQLHLTEATVKGYVSRLLVKLQCANRTQAGLLAYQAGLGEL